MTDTIKALNNIRTLRAQARGNIAIFNTDSQSFLTSSKYAHPHHPVLCFSV